MYFELRQKPYDWAAVGKSEEGRRNGRWKYEFARAQRAAQERPEIATVEKGDSQRQAALDWTGLAMEAK